LVWLVVCIFLSFWFEPIFLLGGKNNKGEGVLSKEEKTGMAGKTVCVTGASGFIASWLVKLLLERGYTVRGTVRNPEKAKHLLQLPSASDHLKLFAADLLKPGCFDEIVQGCDGVFHTASPFFYKNVADPQAQFIDPAVKGTVNVLASCAKAHTKRVVLTSSVAAVAITPKNTPGVVIDESFWSDPDYCRERKVWWICWNLYAL
jgi:nucleoside-diphosphate-sugar epimerase